MVEVAAGLFTVGVFQDVAWATKGLDALRRAGFASESITVMAKDGTDASALIERALGSAGERIEVADIGPLVGRGPLVAALQGSAGDLKKLGVAGTMRRVGFQPHDARIFEALTGRGGVLVAIRNEPRAADALAILHSYGGGNAAIGAWSGSRLGQPGREKPANAPMKIRSGLRGISFAVAAVKTVRDNISTSSLPFQMKDSISHRGYSRQRFGWASVLARPWCTPGLTSRFCSSNSPDASACR
jgi:hypothetical protein